MAQHRKSIIIGLGPYHGKLPWRDFLLDLDMGKSNLGPNDYIYIYNYFSYIFYDFF